jgi:hypothetical protein
MTHKTKRVRCSDEKFLEAIFASKTYPEIAEKTGQKITTTMARYARIKSKLAKKGIDIPVMERAKYVKKSNNIESMIETVKKLKEIYKR